MKFMTIIFIISVGNICERGNTAEPATGAVQRSGAKIFGLFSS